ncbi:MAG: hypothetical protein ACRCZZ_04745 [Phocaeicola sp.]
MEADANENPKETFVDTATYMKRFYDSPVAVQEEIMNDTLKRLNRNNTQRNEENNGN